MIFQTDGRRMVFRINLAPLAYSRAFLNARGELDTPAAQLSHRAGQSVSEMKHGLIGCVLGGCFDCRN